MSTQSFYYSTDELIAHPEASPLPLSVIPDHMGINLVALDGMTVTKRDDGQLVTLSLHFKPSDDPADLPDSAS